MAGNYSKCRCASITLLPLRYSIDGLIGRPTDKQLGGGLIYDFVYCSHEMIRFVDNSYNLSSQVVYEREPYRWSTTDYIALTTDASSVNKLIGRNRKLCAMWEHVYSIMVTLPPHLLTHMYLRDSYRRHHGGPHHIR